MVVVVPKLSEALSLAACMARWRRDGATAMRACAPESGLGSGNFGLIVPGLATGRGGAGLDKNVPAPDQRTLPLALTLQWRAGRISPPPNVWSPVGSRYSRKIKLTWLRSVRRQRCQLQQCLLRAETATA
uniref:Uncharacterized protein n=1 Tax=Oryza nivara TaxID=4536 RepID=A0A0E0I000_ORYNI